jgi:hypothetical protein
MYRIRLESGEEAVYRTADELALAVGSGVVGGSAEVFHNSASRWLPIDRHPDYRAAVTRKRPATPPSILDAETPESTSGEPIEPLPSATFALQPESDTPSADPTAATEIIEEYDPTKDPTPILSEGPPPAGQSDHRARRLRLWLALAIILGGFGLAGGGALVAWRYLLPLLEQGRPSPRLTEGMSPEPVPLVRGTEAFPTAYSAPSPPVPLSPEPALPVSRSPEFRTSRLEATRNQTPGYYEAYADARAEMADAFDYIQFQQVFSPSRFAAPESLRATRRMVAAATNILRVYRGREVMLEQTYRPDDPGGRGSFREPFETAEAARSLLTDADSLCRPAPGASDRNRGVERLHGGRRHGDGSPNPPRLGESAPAASQVVSRRIASRVTGIRGILSTYV